MNENSKEEGNTPRCQHPRSMQKFHYTRKGVIIRVVAGLVGLALLLFMLQQFEHSQVYHPDRDLYATPRAIGRSFEDVRFASKDGKRLHGWFLPADPTKPTAGKVILLCHGNGGNISHRLRLCEALLKMDVSVLAFDYRGYGLSEGAPSEEGTYLDAQAAFAWLRATGYKPEQIIVMGESLGGGVASELAVREPVSGLILLSTFTSLPALGAELFPWLPVRLISTIHYDTQHKLKSIRIPVLILHSRSDGLIAYKHAEANLKAANPPKMLRELRGTHNDTLFDQGAFDNAMEEFLKQPALSRAASPTSARR